jgi:hypothetical protein
MSSNQWIYRGSRILGNNLHSEMVQFYKETKTFDHYNIEQSNQILAKVKDLVGKQLNNHRRKYLLLSSVGNNSLHQSNKWLYPERNYDLFLVHYQEPDNTDKSNESDYYLYFKGNKMIHYFYLFQTNLIDQYDYVFILDNDNRIDGKSISKLFALATSLKANILAPSIKIPGIKQAEVQRLINYYYQNKSTLKGRFWGIEKLLPDNLKKVYQHVIKYTFWIHMIQTEPIKQKIKCTNLIEDGRYIININLIKRFRKNIEFMRLFVSGILFDQVLAHWANFERMFIVNFINYQHMEPYQNKEKERKEKDGINKFIEENKLTDTKFYEVKPQYVETKSYQLKQFTSKKNPFCKFKKYY